MTYTVWVKEKARGAWQAVAAEPDAEAAWRALKLWLRGRGDVPLPLASAVLPVGVSPEGRRDGGQAGAV